MIVAVTTEIGITHLQIDQRKNRLWEPVRLEILLPLMMLALFAGLTLVIIAVAYNKKKPLSEKQIETLDRIWERVTAKG